VSAAVTSRAQPVQGCDAVRLGRLRYRATCAPGFRDRWFPNGITSEALSRAPALTFNAKDRLQEDWAARACGGRPVLPTHLVPSSTAFIEAARRGMGWGMNPEVLIAVDLAEGALVALPGPPFDVTLHWQWNRIASAALSPLTAAVRSAARAVLLA
jgi:LysR family transcriptional regulator (chromosome initiation inhibitor)